MRFVQLRACTEFAWANLAKMNGQAGVCEGKTARSCGLVDMGPLSDDVCGSAPERRLVAFAGLRLVEMGPDALW